MTLPDKSSLYNIWSDGDNGDGGGLKELC